MAHHEYDATPVQFFDLLSGCGLSLSLMEYFLQGKKPFSKEEFCGQFYKDYNYFYIAYDSKKYKLEGCVICGKAIS